LDTPGGVGTLYFGIFMIDVLALDLGTSVGFAYNRGDKFFCGSWELATAKEIRQWGKDRSRRTKDPRIERLCDHISNLGPVDLIVIEDVLFASSTYAVQLWASLRASVWLCADSRRFEAVPVQTIKMFATGSGNAQKDEMILTAKEWKPDLGEISDDTADAIHIWRWAHEKLGGMKI